MFNTGSQLTITQLVVESADSGLELVESSDDSDVDPAKVGVWVWAISKQILLSKYVIFQKTHHFDLLSEA